jgi:hypothetical protein
MELERDFMELERDVHGISADLLGCFNSYNWLINMVFWEWFYEIGFTIWDLGNGDFTMVWMPEEWLLNREILECL